MAETYYKKPISVVRYDENGLKYLEMLPIEVTPNKNIIDYSEVQDMQPTNNIEQERKWYTAENARKRKTALPVVATALASPALLAGGIGAATSETLIPIVGKALNFGMKAITPSSYTGLFGTGTYNTVLGQSGASALGAAADAGLASYYITSAKRKFDRDPNFRHGAELGLAMLPLIALPESLATKGWRIAEDGKALLSPQGMRFIRNAEGKLQSEASFIESLAAKAREVIRESEKAKSIALLKNLSKLYLSALNELDDMGFRAFLPRTWFTQSSNKSVTEKLREWMTGRPSAVSQEDVDIWMSHMPEYLKIAKDFTKNGMLYKNPKTNKWMGKFADGDVEVVPEEYIVAHSNAFKNSGLKYDGRTYYSGMSTDNFLKMLKSTKGFNKWKTTTRGYAESLANNKGQKGKVVESMVGEEGKVHELLPYAENTKPTPLDYRLPGREVGLDINNLTGEYLGEPLGNGVVNIPKIYTSEPGNVGLPSRWKVHGFDANVKVLRGNNGNFDMTNPNIYKVLIPTISTGTIAKKAIDNSNNKQYD